MTLTRVVNHGELGLALPIWDLRQPLFNALLASYLAEVQQLEDAVWSVYIGTMLPAAVGHALDMLGGLLGEPRQGRTDDAYKTWITARVRMLHSNGTPPDLLALARAVLPAAVSVVLHEYYPGAITVDLIGPIDSLTASSLGTMYKRAKAAGVRIETLSSTRPPGEVFTLGDAALAPQIDVQRGLSDITQLTGGHLASVS